MNIAPGPLATHSPPHSDAVSLALWSERQGLQLREELCVPPGTPSYPGNLSWEPMLGTPVLKYLSS